MGELLKLPMWGVRSIHGVLTLFLCLPPSCALPSVCWATHGSHSWMSHRLGWIQKPSSTCGECCQGCADHRLVSAQFYVCIIPVNTRESHRGGITNASLVPGALHLCPLPEQLGDGKLGSEKKSSKQYKECIFESCL